MRRLTLVSGAIWLLTMPLVMARFHIFNPIAVLINTAVWLPMAGALVSGLALLLCSMIPGPLAAVCATFCNWQLAAVEWLVRFGGRVPYGHGWVPGPAEWWLIGLYAGLGVFAAFPRASAAAPLAAGVAGGLDGGRLHHPLVDHRSHTDCAARFSVSATARSIVLELPDGRTVLYDAGRMAGPTACCRIVSGYLWSRGLTHIDAVVLSHADTDHYNALPELLERFSVGTVYVSPVMFDEQNAVDPIPARGDRAGEGADPRDCLWRPACRAARAAGWRFSIRRRTACRRRRTPTASCLSVEYGGRRVLLPADLQSPGLDEVMAEHPLHCDMLLVPHHGSRTSMPEQLAAWSTPAWSVIQRRPSLRHAARSRRSMPSAAACCIRPTPGP